MKMMQVIAVREVLEHHSTLASKFEFDFNYMSNNCVLYQRRLPPLEESSSGGADESSPEDSDFSTGSLPSPPKYCIVSDLLVFYNM